MVRFLINNFFFSLIFSALIAVCGMLLVLQNATNFEASTTVFQLIFERPESIWDLLIDIAWTVYLVTSLMALAIVVMVLFLNGCYNRNKLLGVKSHLPLVVGVLLFLVACGSSVRVFAIIGAVFVMAAYVLSATLSDARNGIKQTFNAGLFVGAAALLDVGLFLMLPIVFFALFYQRKFYWREWVAPIIGATAPLVVVVSFFPELVASLKLTFQYQQLFNFQPTSIEKLAFTLIGFLVLISLPAILHRIQTSSVSQKKEVYLLFWLTLIGGACGIYMGSWAVLLLFSVPFSTYTLSNFFTTRRKVWVSETLFFCLLLTIVYKHLHPILYP